MLIPEGGIRFRVEHRFIPPDASGNILFERIPPGDNKLFAWEGVTYGEWQDPDFVLPYESKGKRIQIKPLERQENVEVIAIPKP